MITLDSCSTEIIRFLLNRSTPVSAHDLGKTMRVSPRVIQYRLKRIAYFLKEYGVEVISKPNYGILLTGNLKEKRKILKELQENFFIEKQEREFVCKFLLLTSKNPFTYADLAGLFSISRSTVSAEIQDFKKWFVRKGLLMECKPNFGCIVSGPEQMIREALTNLIFKSTFRLKLEDAFMKFCFIGEDFQSRKGDFSSTVKDYFKNIGFIYLNNLLNTILDMPLSDPNAYKLILNLAVQITRILDGFPIQNISQGLGDLNLLSEYYWAQFYAKKIGNYYGVPFTLDEISHTTKFLLDATGAKRSALIAPKTSRIDAPADLDLQYCIETFAYALSRRLHPSLLFDKEFCRNLYLHLSYIEERKGNYPDYENPVVDEIAGTYANIYSIVDTCLADSEMCGLDLPQMEKAFITIHVASALARLDYYGRNKKTVLLVCNVGAATGIFLKEKILSEFPHINIDDVISFKTLLKRKDFNRIDYIISTIPLKMSNLPPVLVVNAYLNERDIDNLKKVLIVDSNTQPHLPAVKPDCGRVLSSLINENLMELQVEVRNKNEAIDKTGALLLRSGFVDSNYIDALKNILNEFGPYMVIWPGVALLHASPDAGVKRLGMSLVTLHSPINFGHFENDPVDVLFAMSIPAGKPIPLLLEQLEELVTNQGSISKIRSTQNKKLVMLEIEKFSRIKDFQEEQ